MILGLLCSPPFSFLFSSYSFPIAAVSFSYLHPFNAIMNDLEGADNASDLPLELLHIESAVWSRRGTLQDSRRPDSTETMFDGVSWLFQKDRLDRKLQRKHLTGTSINLEGSIDLMNI